MEKSQLVNFIAKVMEESGFKVYKDFKASKHIVDIYAVLPTVIGDFVSIVSCKNYDEKWEVGLDVLKETEMVAKSLKASKVVIVSTSSFSQSSINYGSQRNIELIDRAALVALAKKFANKDEEIAHPKETNHEEKMPYESYSEKNTLYDYTTEPGFGSRYYSSEPLNSNIHSKRSLFKRSQEVKERGSKIDWKPILERIFKNPIVEVIIVIILAYLITKLITMLTTVHPGLIGVLKIILAAIFSFGIVFLLERDGSKVLLKGTPVFFISIIITIIMILFRIG